MKKRNNISGLLYSRPITQDTSKLYMSNVGTWIQLQRLSRLQFYYAAYSMLFTNSKVTPLTTRDLQLTGLLRDLALTVDEVLDTAASREITQRLTKAAGGRACQWCSEPLASVIMCSQGCLLVLCPDNAACPSTAKGLCLGDYRGSNRDLA